MAGGNGARRADLVNRIERKISDALTEVIFGDDGGAPVDGLLQAAVALSRSGGNDADAAAKFECAGWHSPLIGRAPAQTLYADLAGAAASTIVAGRVPQQIIDRVSRRQRAARAMVDALADDLELGERPYVTGPPTPPTPATETAEFGEVGSRTITVAGQYVTPSHIARSADLAWQAASRVEDAIMALIAEDALAGTAAWLRDKLVASAGTAVADVPAALLAIEGAGWSPDTILLPLSRVDRLGALAELPPAATSGLTIVAGAPVGARVLVLARAGVDARVSDEATANIAEPSIGGLEVSVSYWGVYQAAADAVKQVTA